MSATTDLFHAGLERLAADDLEGYLALCDDDVEYEFPFAPPGRPRHVRGRAALRQYLEPLLAQVSYDEITGLRVYETDAPDTVVVEMAARVHRRDSGGELTMRYVAVVRSAAGRVVAYRDYWDPLALDQLGGGGAR